MGGVKGSTAFALGYEKKETLYGGGTGGKKSGQVKPGGKTAGLAGNPSVSAVTENPSMSAVTENPAPSARRRNRDIADLSSGRNQAVSDSAISTLFGVLSKDYPGIVILAENQGGTRDVRQIAAELGCGTYLVVSQGFLERMGRSQEDYDVCKSVLTEALRRLSSGKKEVISQGT